MLFAAAHGGFDWSAVEAFGVIASVLVVILLAMRDSKRQKADKADQKKAANDRAVAEAAERSRLKDARIESSIARLQVAVGGNKVDPLTDDERLGLAGRLDLFIEQHEKFETYVRGELKLNGGKSLKDEVVKTREIATSTQAQVAALITRGNREPGHGS